MEKGFDAVGFMREQRIRIDRETEGLSWQERREYIRKSLEDDPLWESLKHRVVTVGEAPEPATTKP